ncbi:MAG: PAS domain S-box protein [Caldisericia bacterium]|nr:PAS domain S-box protein [Caldisericia bacterium]
MSENPKTMRRVCISEDDVGIANLISRKLTKKGYEVIICTTGEETIKELTEDNRCLLLLDFILPDYTADELISVLDGRGIQAPFIMMTGQGDERVAVEMMKRGARDYIIKDSQFLDIIPEIVSKVFLDLDRERKLKKTERDLEMTQFRYRMMAENIQDGIIIIEDGTVTYANPRMLEVTGFSTAEIKEMGVHDLVASFEKERLKIFRENYKRNKLENDSIGFWIERRGGGFRYVTVKISSVTISRNDFIFMIFSDITEEKLAQKALTESESKYRMIFESVPIAIITVSDDGAILSFNPSAEKMLGYSRDEMLGSHAGKLLPDIISEEDSNMPSLCPPDSDTPRLAVETVALKANGQKVPVEFSCAKWKIQSFEITALILIDITNRKLHEAHLIASYKIQKILFEEEDTEKAIRDVFEVMGKTIEVDRVYLFENNTIAGEDCFSRRIKWCSDPDDPALAQTDDQYLQDLLSTELGFGRWDKAFKSKSLIKGIVSEFPESEKKFLELQGIKSIIVLPMVINNHVGGFVGFDDRKRKKIWTKHEESMLITLVNTISVRVERELIQKEIIKSRQLLHAAIESIEEAVLVLDTDFSVRLVNSNFYFLFMEDDETINDPIELITKMVESGDTLVDLMKEISTTKKEFAENCRLVTGKHLECFSCPLDPLSPDSGRIWTFRDITNKMRQEKAKREFINSVAHELRNPLVLIQGYTEILLENRDRHSDERAMLDIIYDATMREIRQVSDFVDVGRTNPTYNFRLTDAYDLFYSIAERCGVYIDKQVQHIYVGDKFDYNYFIERNLMDVKINVDPERIQEIIENLVINSIKYSDKNKIDISFKAWLDDDFVCFSITDKGVGIPKDDLAKVFKPFYQVSRGRDMLVGGLGLGLANVMLHVNSHNGKISIDSEVGLGTIVTVKITKSVGKTSQTIVT